MTVEEVNVLVKEAGEAERNGEFLLASEKYRSAANGLMMLTHGMNTNDDTFKLYTQRAGEYLQKCTEMLELSKEPKQVLCEASVCPVQVAPVNSTGMERDSDDGFEHIGEAESEFSEKEMKVGAAVAGSGLGMLVGSIFCIPCIISGPAGGAAAVHYVDKDTKNGRRARKVAIYGARTVRYVQSVNEKYRVTERCKNAATGCYKGWSKPEKSAQTKENEKQQYSPLNQ